MLRPTRSSRLGTTARRAAWSSAGRYWGGRSGVHWRRCVPARSGSSGRARQGMRVTVAASFSDLLSGVEATGSPLYVPAAKAFITPIPAGLVSSAVKAYDPVVQLGVAAGLVAFSQACPYDGIQLLFCASSAWFECLGCGSQFTMFGEKRGGPAPRGMSLIALIESGKGIVIDTERTAPGLRIGVDFSHQQAAGPHCF
jgi:cytochrome b6-f complex iron-sulfur subunit